MLYVALLTYVHKTHRNEHLVITKLSFRTKSAVIRTISVYHVSDGVGRHVKNWNFSLSSSSENPSTGLTKYFTMSTGLVSTDINYIMDDNIIIFFCQQVSTLARCAATSSNCWSTNFSTSLLRYDPHNSELKPTD